MAKFVEILRDNLREHPATQAWRATAPEPVEPEMIAVLKRKREKSNVFRLAGVGPAGAAVIAKRCRLKTAAVERMIYEEFLPLLPLPAVRCYGSVEDPDGQSCWLFLEEASGELYSALNPAHRALAARWLAAVHSTSQRVDSEMRLPDRSPEQYLQMLQSLSAEVREHFANPDASPDDLTVLQMIAQQCDVLKAHWSEIEQACQGTPRTLVHGDFVVKNLRVRHTADGPALLVYDWEYAGWGIPSTDLAQHTGYTASPDLAVYRSCLEDWPTMADESQVERLALCGKFFRLLDDLTWASSNLKFGGPEFLISPIYNFRAYGERMARTLNETGWIHHD